jgi:hypothetical protein
MPLQLVYALVYLLFVLCVLRGVLCVLRGVLCVLYVVYVLYALFPCCVSFVLCAFIVFGVCFFVYL